MITEIEYLEAKKITDQYEEQLNITPVMRYFFITFKGHGTTAGSLWFEADGYPSHVKIKEVITTKFTEVSTPAIMSIVEMNEKDFKALNCV